MRADVIAVLAACPRPMTAREIAARIDYPPSTVAACLRSCPEVVRVGAGSASAWRLSESFTMSFALYDHLADPAVVADAPPTELAAVPEPRRRRPRCSGDTIAAVRGALIEHGRSAAWLAARVGVTTETARYALSRLAAESAAVRCGYGRWRRP